MSITRELREAAAFLGEDLNNRFPGTSQLLDIANKVERLEGNLLYLISITCASAEGFASKRTTGKGELERQLLIMETCQKAIAGIPASVHSHSEAWVKDRVTRAHTEVLKTFNERNSKQ